MPEYQSMLVETTYGPIIGYEDAGFLTTESTVDHTHLITSVPVTKFLGVPYGQAERWKRAQPPTPWKEPLLCHKFGPSFPQWQVSPLDDFFRERLLSLRHSEQSEEKGFTVNIFCPSGVKEGENLPVLVWVYGGGLLHGCSSIPVYDPTEWIRREASNGRKFIVVTGNHRTNLLGFLASSDLAEEDPEGLAGNYGAYDCISYFQWVQKNISKFGGDPDNVTAFGESAGATMLAYLMLCKEKLFRRVILQSGAINTKPYISWQTHQDTYQELLTKASITAESREERLNALRELPIAQLMEYFSTSHYQVGFAPENASSPAAIWSESCPLSRLKAGNWSPHIESVMMGFCKDEGGLFAWMTASHTREGFDRIRNNFLAGADEQKLRQLYDLPNQANIDNPPEGAPLDVTRCSGSLAVADRLFKVPFELLLAALDGAKNWETQKPLSIYVYTLEGTVIEATPPSRFCGVSHMVDIALVFNMCHLWAAGSESARISATVGRAWYDYAKEGRPGGTKWPAYQRDRSPYKLLFRQDGGSALHDVRKRPEGELHRMPFWADQFGLAQFWDPPAPHHSASIDG
ncbi:hypothetical protein PCANC_20798 [Puccinia coronata f. sp. avenae]|uniref:Carboxylesterase type B domain-containing protein n=1 Tax=Puccinia coronata f. sp. avenae TaxID=200324 RepID=A0A2N5U8E7_9BASI|nr:hypothetical protein PCANC_20798 [Puccinia coronata f. sp. avenae]